MNILLVNTLYHPLAVGGAERSVQSLAEELARLGHEVAVATLSPDGLRSETILGGVEVRRLPLRNLYFPFRGRPPGAAKKSLWHLLDTWNPAMEAAAGAVMDQVRPEAVNTHNIAGFSAAVWRAAKRRGLPLVHTLRDQYLLCPRTTMFRDGRNCIRQCAACKLYSLPRLLATRQADLVTGVSRFILRRHRDFNGFPGVPEAVIHNGCPPPAEKGPLPPEKDAKGPLHLGFLGKVHPSKGLEPLIEAFQALPPGAAELWIAGKGEPSHERKLRRRTATDGSVHWMGFVEPRRLLERIRVLVAPSLWHDTAPRNVLEAFACGRPVLGSRRGGIPELIAPETGWTYDPDLPGALKEALERILDERSRLAAMSEAALRRARRFDLSAMARKYLRAYRSATEK